jgi:uncharacterized protein with PIN domain
MRSRMHLADGMLFGSLLHIMPIVLVDDGVLDVHRERIRILSDRLLFVRNRALRNSLRKQLETEIRAARRLRNDPALCPRCLELRGTRTGTIVEEAQDLYACTSCGQVWVAAAKARIQCLLVDATAVA